MKIITPAEFKAKKRHDGIAIMGSGRSLLKIPGEEWEAIEDNYDTFGMNWYCKSERPTTWYLVREQAITPKRCEPGMMLTDFYEHMQAYSGSCKIVKDLGHKPTNFQHALHIDKFDGDGIIIKEPQCGASAKSFRDDLFDVGLHHGKGTIYDALHFSVAMEYKRILFCGVDLYDTRYFWLEKDESTIMTLMEGRTSASPHLMADKTLKIVNQVAEVWGIEMAVENPMSLLNKVIPVWRYKQCCTM